MRYFGGWDNSIGLKVVLVYTTQRFLIHKVCYQPQTFDPGPTPWDRDTLSDVSLTSVESPLYRSRIPFYCFGFGPGFLCLFYGRVAKRMDHALLASSGDPLALGSGSEWGDEVIVPDPLLMFCAGALTHPIEKRKRIDKRRTRARMCIQSSYLGTE